MVVLSTNTILNYCNEDTVYCNEDTVYCDEDTVYCNEDTVYCGIYVQQQLPHLQASGLLVQQYIIHCMAPICG